MLEPPEGMRVGRFGPFEVNLTTGELRKHGMRLRLQEQPFQVLALLLARSGKLVTREEIRERLWPSGTFVDFDNGLNTALSRLREVLGDSAEHPRYIETLARRGYRCMVPFEWVESASHDVLTADATGSLAGATPPIATGSALTGSSRPISEEPVRQPPQRTTRWRRLVLAGGTLAIVVLAAGTFFYFPRRPKLTEKDSVVLADFVNSTGDPVFDGSLREALAAKLDESPYFNVVSDAALKQTLRLMKQPVDAHLTPELAREVCQRGVSGAVLVGTISSIGNKYVLTLNAMNCVSGASLARIEADADGKDNILAALGKLASSMRGRLGETLASVEKFNSPVEQVTTGSLEALKAYALGRSAFGRTDFSACVPFFQRATTLDPNFAMAYAVLAAAYANLGEAALAQKNATKAFALHDRVSERERLYIDTHYYDLATGDFNKAAEVYLLWEKMYPRDANPWNNLGVLYRDMGQQQNAEQQLLGDLRLDPGDDNAFNTLGQVYRAEGRFEESRSVLQKAVTQMPSSPYYRSDLAVTAFAMNDRVEILRQVAWLNNNAHEDEALLLDASPGVLLGKLKESRRLTDRIISNAQQKRAIGWAVSAVAQQANAEALFGELQQARSYAERAISFQPDDPEPAAVQALALSGQLVRAERFLDELAKKHPDDTLLNGIEFPVARAILAMARHDAGRALTILEPVERYRLAPDSATYAGGYPPIHLYLRGLAYLQVKQGKEAAVEFQTILDHPGLYTFSPTYPLAELGLARARALQGDVDGARTAYKAFFTFWKDADPDIPVLIAAQAEYTNLH